MDEVEFDTETYRQHMMTINTAATAYRQPIVNVVQMQMNDEPKFLMEVHVDLFGSFSRNISKKINMCKKWNQLILQHASLLTMEYDADWILNGFTDADWQTRNSFNYAKENTQNCSIWEI